MIDPTIQSDVAHGPVAPEAPKQPLKRSHRWLTGLGTVGLLLVIGVPLAYTQLATQERASSEAGKVNILGVETLTVEPVSSYVVSRTYTGEMAALRSSDLGFQRGGEVIAVLVQEGDRVLAGQALAQLEIQNLQVQRQQFEAQKAEAQARLLELEQGARREDIAAAEAEVRDLENQLKLQEAQRSRREFLYAEGAIAREQLDEFAFGAEALKARLDRARSQLNELLNGTRIEQITAQRAVVQQLEASIADVDVTISKSTLKSPFDGIISTRQVDEGAVVGSGQSVVRLVEDAAPEARIGIPTDAANQLQVGNRAAVAAKTDRYSATVAAVLPEVDPNTRTQVVVFQLEPAAIWRINPGQTLRVEMTETIPAEGIWLPTEALTQGIRGLWNAYAVVPAKAGAEARAIEGNTAYEVQPQAVEILQQESDRVLVRGTLQAGDRVVARGVHRLVPGQRVQPL